MSFKLITLAACITLTLPFPLSLADQAREAPTLPKELKQAVTRLESPGGKEKAHGNSPQATSASKLMSISLGGLALANLDSKSVGKLLEDVDENDIWVQHSDHGVAILIACEGYEKLEGEDREFLVGFLWGSAGGLAGLLKPAPKNVAIAFVEDSAIKGIIHGKADDYKPKHKDLKPAILVPYFK